MIGRRRVVSLAGGSLLALAFALGLAGTVTAHTPSVYLTCGNNLQPTLVISLTNYNGTIGHTNTVSASIDGSSVLSTTGFHGSYSNSFSAGSPYVGHTAQVIIFAWDDPSGVNGWTKTIPLSSFACKTATAAPTGTPVVTARPTATPVITAPPTATPVVTAPPTATPFVTATPVITPTPAVTDTPIPTETPFESFQGETATPAATATPDPSATDTPFETFQGETATPAASATPPPTSTDGGSSGSSGTPFIALLVCLAFGGLGLLAIEGQRRSVKG